MKEYYSTAITIQYFKLQATFLILCTIFSYFRFDISLLSVQFNLI